MHLQNLFESPLLTHPQGFGLDDAEKNIKMAKEMLSNKNKTPIEKFGDGEYTLYELPRKYVLIDHSDKEPKIIYLMQYEVNFHKFIGRQCAQQVIVWKNFRAPHTEDIAKNIFFNHLLQSYQTVITDSMQTPDGQHFWDNRVANSLQKGFYVYYVSLIPHREIVRIANLKQYDELANNKDVWGNEGKHRARRVLITTKQLAEEN
jgi:hypothetical protein